MIESGQSYLQVSKSLEIARSTLYMWQREYGWPLPKAGSVQNRPRKPKSPASISVGVTSAEEDEASEQTDAILDELVEEIERLVMSDLPAAVVQEALPASFDALLGVIEPTAA